MPFPIVMGIPEDTWPEVLAQLRRDIVASLVETTGRPASWMRPFFPSDLLDDPEEPEDGCQTIYIRLDTGLLHGKSGDEVDALAAKITGALAQVVSAAFGGKYEVECFIGDANPKWRSLVHAKPPPAP